MDQKEIFMRLKKNIIIAAVSIAVCIALLVAVKFIPNVNIEETGNNEDEWTQKEDTSVVLVNYESGSYVNSKIIVECADSPYTLAKTVKEDGTVQYIIESHPTVEVIPESVNALANNFSYVVMADTIEENPSDLALYGLDNPQGKYTLVNENGSSKTVLIGNKIGTMYYSMLEGDPKVYTIYGAYGDAVLGGINGLRETNLVNIQSGKIGEQLKVFRIDDRNGCLLNIRLATESDRISSSSSKFLMTEPYNMPVYSSKLIELLPSFTPVNVSSFVEDNPTDLSKYGLDNPQYTLTLEDNEDNTYVIYFGNLSADGRRVYCMMKGKNFVFDMLKNKLDAFAAVDPYVLCERYAHLISINDISSVQVISADGSKNYTMTVDKNTQELFFLNGKPAEDDSFREAYRYITGISFSADAGDGVAKTTEALRIVFNFDDGTSYTAVYYEYDDRNYVLDRNGENSNFLVAKKSVTEMYGKLDKVKTY